MKVKSESNILIEISHLPRNKEIQDKAENQDFRQVEERVKDAFKKERDRLTGLSRRN